eukprot:CAMPEP_0179469760 /NCGR_PEP_ID=MMETSP0799-20121207/50363_1 /TAXON_ID=46947 /ORGANISM="Geminigera cryophila, Strain CCMP2564" /LENGTH=35 /DNA_ID= /DNA_START= /DNA_END= /DNA_ORIENTATION=
MWGYDAAAPAAGGVFVLVALMQLAMGMCLHKINTC